MKQVEASHLKMDDYYEYWEKDVSAQSTSVAGKRRKIILQNILVLDPF